jgi:hypothetical protein
MTSKEKAKELVDKFKPHSHFWVHDLGRQKDYEIEQLENAKQCALIAVDEAIEESYFVDKTYCRQEYWEEVKQEIEKL